MFEIRKVSEDSSRIVHRIPGDEPAQPTPPEFVLDRVDRHPRGPFLDAARIAESRDAAKDANEDLVDGVLRFAVGSEQVPHQSTDERSQAGIEQRLGTRRSLVRQRQQLLVRQLRSRGVERRARRNLGIDATSPLRLDRRTRARRGGRGARSEDARRSPKLAAIEQTHRGESPPS